MNGEQLRKAQEIFEELVDLPSPRRGPILDDRCRGDQELRTFVEQLLAEHDRDLGDFLQKPDVEITKLLGERRTPGNAPFE